MSFPEAFQTFIDHLLAEQHRARVISLTFTVNGFHEKGFLKFKTGIYHFESSLAGGKFFMPIAQPKIVSEEVSNYLLEVLPSRLTSLGFKNAWVVSGREKQPFLLVSIKEAIANYADYVGGSLLLLGDGKEAIYVNEYGEMWFSYGLQNAEPPNHSLQARPP